MGFWAILLACICFLTAMAVPLFVQRWKSFVLVLAAAAVFFGWLTLEMDRDGTIPAAIGSFLGGLMLTGFAFGAISRFVSLIGKKPAERQ